VDLRTLVRRTDGLVGSDIQWLCQRASMNAIRKFIKGRKDVVNARSKELVITGDEFEAALRSIQSGRP
jgi:transitional endoplasmic reticulum ATPase